MEPENPVKSGTKTYRMQTHKDKSRDSKSVYAPRLEKLKCEEIHEWKGNNSIVKKRNEFLST